MSNFTRRFTDRLRAIARGRSEAPPQVEVTKWVYVPGCRLRLPEELALRIMARASKCEMRVSEFMALVQQAMELREVDGAR